MFSKDTHFYRKAVLSRQRPRPRFDLGKVIWSWSIKEFEKNLDRMNKGGVCGRESVAFETEK